MVLALLSLYHVPTERLILFWVLLVVCGVVGYFLCRRKRAFLLLVLPAAFILSVGFLNNIAYSSYGRGWSEEIGFGPVYLIGYVGIGIGYIAPLVGAFRKRR